MRPFEQKFETPTMGALRRGEKEQRMKSGRIYTDPACTQFVPRSTVQQEHCAVCCVFPLCACALLLQTCGADPILWYCMEEQTNTPPPSNKISVLEILPMASPIPPLVEHAWMHPITRHLRSWGSHLEGSSRSAYENSPRNFLRLALHMWNHICRTSDKKLHTNMSLHTLLS